MRRTLIVFFALLFAAPAANAAPVVNGIFDLPKQASRLAADNNGNIWVTLQSNDPDVARVGPDGTVTPFTAADLDSPVGITLGPDGNMWVTQTNFVAKFSPADPTGASKTQINAIGSKNGIVVGQDNNLWTGSDANVIRIPPADPGNPLVIPSGVGGFSARETAAATDGKIWVVNGDGSNPGLLPVTLAGTAGTQVNGSITGNMQGVAAGPGGQIAYSQPQSDPQQIGLINGGVLATPFAYPAPADPNGVLFGQDGAYWIAESNPSAIGRYSTAGVYTKFADMPAGSFPRRLAQGASGTIWVILERPGEDFSRIARITGVEVPGSGQTAAPVVSKLSLTNSKFKVGAKKTAKTGTAKAKTGTTIKFTLDKPAAVTFTIEQPKAGKRSGKNCVKPTRKLRKKKNCKRYVAVKGQTFTRNAKSGANSVAYSGRVGSSKLRPGPYRLSITARDATSSASAPRTKTFTIVKR